jgi:hypothetical protein
MQVVQSWVSTILLYYGISTILRFYNFRNLQGFYEIMILQSVVDDRRGGGFDLVCFD